VVGIVAVTELRDQLQTALGSGYRIEKELGGGGMSRVFLAEEIRLGRRVVVKVLPPDMAAGVNVERFRREIRVAAQLQHPHIVPLLTAGASGDLLYYMMPFIEGESLRARLASQGEMPVDEALAILRDVLDALAYAHRRSVVHRDIKPDNVLVSEGHAMITDFGVAKAVIGSIGGQSLTSVGVALGTPHYMPPEQVAADPSIDHRADVYSAGVLVYEMLCGRPPFAGRSPAAVMAAHVTQTPGPCTAYRPVVSDALNALVMRCLEKDPAARWQSADELLPHVTAMLASTGAARLTGSALDYEAIARRAHPVRVALLFGFGSIAVLALVYTLVLALGLPDWVFPAAIALLAMGLPIMLTTGVFERRRALQRRRVGSRPAAAVSSEKGVRALFTWRRALLGGGLASAALAVATGGYMAMRQLGIGPYGTLMARGAIAERDLLMVTDFANRTADSSLGPSITEALRIDLGQSSAVRVLDAAATADALQRMNRDPSAVVRGAIARELAQREGVAALVSGEISALGRGYILSARVESAADGVELVALRESAADDASIIGAVDELSARLRERLGESLKSIRASEPLAQVTTGSLEALRRYTQASRFLSRADYTGAIPLLEAGIAIDSTFAMAHRKLSVSFYNTGAARSRTIAAARAAFRYRHRLPPTERYLADAYYYAQVEPDHRKEIAAYLSVLELDPHDLAALNNLANRYNRLRRYGEAEQMATRAIAVDDAAPFYGNALRAQVAQGKFAAAETTLARFAARLPGSANVLRAHAELATVMGDFSAAAIFFDSLVRGGQGAARIAGYDGLADLALMRGRLVEAEGFRRRAMAANEARAVPAAYVDGALSLAYVQLRHRTDPQAALKEVDAALSRHPLPVMPAADRPYTELAAFYADAGRPDLAAQMMSEYRREVDEALRRAAPGALSAAGSIQLATGRLRDALVTFRRLRELPVPGTEGGPLEESSRLAEAYDRLGETDSALASYERFATTPFLSFGGRRPLLLAPTYRRLGELYEQRGDRDKAAEFYGKFIELWKDADPELQPMVQEVKPRMARLAGERS
jgi:tetratricopeptide (TPR) repeat protein